MSDLSMMLDFANAYEQRWRDVKKRSHCLSAEWRYVPESLQNDVHERENQPFGEDAFLTGLWAWQRVPDGLKDGIKVAFGFGAHSQTERENRLEATIRRMGYAAFDKWVLDGLNAWLNEIKVECETQADFELIFYH